MGYAIATVTGGSGDEAHYKVLAAIKTLAEANGWSTLRYVSTGADRELILNSTGLSGTEDIYIGFKTYQDVGADYYNIAVSCFTGYVSANSFETQPGARLSGVPCHNNAVTYFITANAQRIVGCFKVGTPVYAHFYVGKMYPYGRPGEFPSPLCAGGAFDAKEARRFSDTGYTFPYYGAYGFSGSNPTLYGRMYLRAPDGVYRQYYMSPFNQMQAVGLAGVRTSDTYYHLLPITMFEFDTPTGKGNVWGELDGVTFVTGFNNGTENVLQNGGTLVDQTGMTVLQAVDAIIAAGGRAHIILQDTGRNGFNNYIALEMS
jgi:hypothetical protein